MTPDGDPADDFGGALTVESGCLRERTWRYRVQRTVPAVALVAELERCGWVDESRFAVLREMRHPAGHRILVVPETGRIQIRLDLDVPAPERRAAAALVATDLQAALRALDVPEAPST